MIITIDGASGTGKTSIAKQVAHTLGFTFLDTGATYRAIAYLVDQKNIETSHEEALKDLLQQPFLYKVVNKDRQQYHFLGEIDISKAIRKEKIGIIASKISTYPFIRDYMVMFQRNLVGTRDAVCEGRDMGTVVFPQATLKLFLTASLKVRGKRRYSQLAPNEQASYSLEQIIEQIKERDQRDTQREHSPLKPAQGAICLDTSHLTEEEVLDHIINLQAGLV